MSAWVWVSQILLALAFALAGLAKSTLSRAQLTAHFPWSASMPVGVVRFIGVAELAGAIGLVAPAASHVAPELTPLAALGLMSVMLLATVVHVRRGESGMVPINLTLGALAAFVAWSRHV